jgi:hypothetical protein
VSSHVIACSKFYSSRGDAVDAGSWLWRIWIFKSLCERYRQAHGTKAKMWHSHFDVEHSARGKANIKKWFPHFDFDDPRNHTKLPSLSYLLAVAIGDIESRIPFYTRKLQMEGRQHLLADHSTTSTQRLC